MLFNSFGFLVFFVIVFTLYWFVLSKNFVWQNMLLLVASYVFYGFWDWRFLSLIFISSLSDYLIALQLRKIQAPSSRKTLLVLSIVINLSMLGFFKYYNFFTENLIQLFNTIGLPFQPHLLHIILPVGISFYTFQTMSYTIDVYRNQGLPEKNPITFFLFVGFFPQLVAGPIERATNLLPQFKKPRTFNAQQGADGLRQVLWGLFQKVVIADNCAEYVNMAFNDPTNYSSVVLAIAAFLFAIQIYGDFAGYSNMAIGMSRLLGFNLMQNFNAPYFSKSITEIWRRWHISFSTWLRDYLFTPLALSFRNLGTKGILLSTLITFTISGLWHGANWNFIFWGFLHGLALSYEILTKKIRKKAQKSLPVGFYTFMSIIFTFGFWVFGLIFFRSADTTNGFVFLKSLFTNGFDMGNLPFQSKTFTLFLLIAFFMIIDYIGKDKRYAIEGMNQIKNAAVRWGFYFMLVFLILAFYPTQGTQFIYFQF